MDQLTNTQCQEFADRITASLHIGATWEQIDESYNGVPDYLDKKVTPDRYAKILWVAYEQAIAQEAAVTKTPPLPRPKLKTAPATKVEPPATSAPAAQTSLAEDGEDNRPAQFLDAIAEFEKQGDSLGQHFNASHISLVENAIRAKLPKADLIAANKVITKAKQRQLTYRDIAFAFCVHKKNLDKSEVGQSTVSGIVGMSKADQMQELVDNPLEMRQAAMCLLLLEQIGFTKVVEKADAKLHKAGRYQITISDDLQMKYDDCYFTS